MTADEYLQAILQREAVNTSATSPALAAGNSLLPLLRPWAAAQLRAVNPSGSFAKGTANLSSTDIDLFISLKSDTTNTLRDIYESLFSAAERGGYAPRRQNVSINVRVGGCRVDLVPAKHQGGNSEDHSLYKRRSGTWTQTNIARHITTVRQANRIAETRVLKLWRDQKGLDFPSFYLELTMVDALTGARGTLSQNVQTAFEYLRDRFPNARVVDPANTNNIISDDLSAAQKLRIAELARQSRNAPHWGDIVR